MKTKGGVPTNGAHPKVRTKRRNRTGVKEYATAVPEPHAIYIVRCFAQCRTVPEITQGLREEFQIEQDRQSIRRLMPGNREFPAWAVPIFSAAREDYLKSTDHIPLAHKVRRLEELNYLYFNLRDEFDKTIERLNDPLLLSLAAATTDPLGRVRRIKSHLDLCERAMDLEKQLVSTLSEAHDQQEGRNSGRLDVYTHPEPSYDDMRAQMVKDGFANEDGSPAWEKIDAFVDAIKFKRAQNVTPHAIP